MSDRLWEIEDVIALLDAVGAARKFRMGASSEAGIEQKIAIAFSVTFVMQMV